MAKTVRLEVVFRGRVQGVFFRATALEVAARFAVTGWVRNEPDGSVRCVAEGEREELDRFIAAVCDAKRANIDRCHVTEAEATREYTAFRIVR